MSEHASTAQDAIGFEFQWKDDVIVGFSEVHNVLDLGLPNITNTEKERTHMGSPNRKREFKPTLGEDEPFDVKINYDWGDPVHVALLNACNERKIGQGKIVWPEAVKTVEGDAYIRNWKWGAMTPDNLQEATFTVRESPAWDWPTS